MTDSISLKLKMRLAAGEISIAEYRELLSELASDDTKSHADTPQVTPPELGAQVAEFEDFRLFERGLSYKSTRYPLSSITSVSGGHSYQSLNLVPSLNLSFFSVGFSNGDSASVIEDRLVFGRKRHESISRFHTLVREATFSQRLANLTKKLLANGEIVLYKSGGADASSVVLRRDGVVFTSTTSVRLKVASASGTFSLGSEWRSLNGMSTKTDPSQVVLSERKGLIGAMIPRDAIRFSPNQENIDIVHGLLEWMAKPNNNL